MSLIKLHYILKRKLKSFLTLFVLLALNYYPSCTANASLDQDSKTFILRVENQSEPGSGFFMKIGTSLFFITAKHVLGLSGESVKIFFLDGRMIDLPLISQLPIPGIDIIIVPINDSQYNGYAPTISEKGLILGEELIVWGYPVTKEKLNTTLSSRIGKYIGASIKSDSGYDLIYSATTQVGFSGGPILNNNGYVVGVHGRSESRPDKDGSSQRTGNALGIPMSIIQTALKQSSSSGSSEKPVNLIALQKDAARISLGKVAEILASSSMSDQVLNELLRAEIGNAPKYCIDIGRAYYYTYYSTLPNISQAKQSFSIITAQSNIPSIYYVFNSVINKKSGDYELALKYSRVAEQLGGAEILQFSERRIRDLVIEELISCSKLNF